jgi:fatty acyl-CoA reductase
MGKVLVEKLLRSCPHLSNIYLLVRSKKGKDVETRLEEIFNDPVRTHFCVSKTKLYWCIRASSMLNPRLTASFHMKMCCLSF